MHTLAEMAKALHRPVIVVTGLQTRFGLPTMAGAGYSAAYLALLEKLVHLRRLNVPEEALRDLWLIEKKLLCLLHVDTAGSTTWFLDSCGLKTHAKRRLLLTNHDVGTDLRIAKLQPGLDFSEAPPELFPGSDMGEDALRALVEYKRLHARIRSEVATELPQVQAAALWARRCVVP